MVTVYHALQRVYSFEHVKFGDVRRDFLQRISTTEKSGRFSLAGGAADAAQLVAQLRQAGVTLSGYGGGSHNLDQTHLCIKAFAEIQHTIAAQLLQPEEHHGSAHARRLRD